MELELGLALPNNHLMKGLDLNDGSTISSYRKRGFEEAFEEVIPFSSPPPRKTTLSLFVHQNGGDGGDENDSPQLKNSHDLNSIRESRALVGWPPVKHPRRRSAGGGAEERWSEHCGSNSDDGGGGGRRAKCVKVKMEGVAIGRKVDLSLHDSYEELFHTLNQMFPNMQHGVAHHHHHHRRRRHFTVTYEDGEGDWLLVGDVPWEAFIRSVKRLNILS